MVSLRNEKEQSKEERKRGKFQQEWKSILEILVAVIKSLVSGGKRTIWYIHR